MLKTRPPGLRRRLAGVLAIAVLTAGAGFAAWAAQPPRSEAGIFEPLAFGRADAPVTIVEYSSLGCPHCATQFGVSKAIKDSYVDKGQVRYIFADMTLGQKGAAESALLARCAGPDRYYKLAEAIYARQEEIYKAKDPKVPLLAIALSHGVSKAAFNRCESPTNLAAMKALNQSNAGVGQIEGTPTLVITSASGRQTRLLGDTSLAKVEAAIREVQEGGLRTAQVLSSEADEIRAAFAPENDADQVVRALAVSTLSRDFPVRAVLTFLNDRSDGSTLRRDATSGAQVVRYGADGQLHMTLKQTKDGKLGFTVPDGRAVSFGPNSISSVPAPNTQPRAVSPSEVREIRAAFAPENDANQVLRALRASTASRNANMRAVLAYLGDRSDGSALRRDTTRDNQLVRFGADGQVHLTLKPSKNGDIEFTAPNGRGMVRRPGYFSTIPVSGAQSKSAAARSDTAPRPGIQPISNRPAISAKFDMASPVTVTGVISRIEWKTSGAIIHVGEAGGKEWAIFTGTPRDVARAGATDATLRAGMTITARGFNVINQTRDTGCGLYADIENLMDAAGRPLFQRVASLAA